MGFPVGEHKAEGASPVVGAVRRVDSRAGAANGRGPFAGGTFAFANGKVTAVTGSSVTMSGTLRSGFGQAPKSKNTKKPSTPKTQQLTVTLSKSTTLSETQSTSFSALAVGDCVNAFGQAGSTGAVTAATVSIRSTGGQTCSTGFRPGGFGGA